MLTEENEDFHKSSLQPTTQWILVDHPGELRPELAELPNIGKDTFDNVLKILND